MVEAENKRKTKLELPIHCLHCLLLCLQVTSVSSSNINFSEFSVAFLLQDCPLPHKFLSRLWLSQLHLPNNQCFQNNPLFFSCRSLLLTEANIALSDNLSFSLLRNKNWSLWAATWHTNYIQAHFFSANSILSSPERTHQFLERLTFPVPFSPILSW